MARCLGAVALGASVAAHAALFWALGASSPPHLAHGELALNWQPARASSSARAPKAAARPAPRMRPRATAQPTNAEAATELEADAASAPSAATPSPVAASALGIAATYPRLSRILREEGRVILAVDRESPPRVLRSSGFARLDQAALAAALRAAEDGTLDIASAPQLAFIFRLREN